MKFQTLEVMNFGPYYGKQVIEFPEGPQSVMLIHGDNMSGKTSLFNAIRWCLYGVAKDRSSKPMQTRDLLNVNAFDAGTRVLSVTIRLVDEIGGRESELELTRQRMGKQGVPVPTQDTDFEEHLSIEKDGVVLTPNDFSELVGDLIPEDISRFFLFDGELLKEYEALVREGGEREGRVVRESIEMILGLPSATFGRDDMVELKRDLDKRLSRESKRNDKSEEASSVLDQLNEDLDVAKSDLGSLKKQEEAAARYARDLDENLKQYEESREDAGQKIRLEMELDSVASDRERLFEQRREHASAVWRDVLAPRIRSRLDHLDEELVEQQRLASDLAGARDVARKLENTLDSGNCESCGQLIDSSHKAKASADLNAAERQIEKIESVHQPKRLSDLQGIVSNLRKIAPAGVAKAIGILEEDLAQATVREDKAKRDLEKVIERLGQVDATEIRGYEKQRRHYETEIGRLREQVKSKEEDLNDLRSKIGQQRDIVLKNKGGGFEDLEIERDLVDAIESIFDEAIDRLTEDLRLQVQEAATRIFLQLTTDKSYSGLSINDRYGLTILLENGDPISVRSAGAEQVVALSLIAALNMLAAKRGPVIMDTPLGRLDKKHRKNILEFLPSLADQVTLMVHDGEVDRETDLEPIAPWVGAEYRIHHPTPTESQLLSEGEAH